MYNNHISSDPCIHSFLSKITVHTCSTLCFNYQNHQLPLLPFVSLFFCESLSLCLLVSSIFFRTSPLLLALSSLLSRDVNKFCKSCGLMRFSSFAAMTLSSCSEIPWLRTLDSLGLPSTIVGDVLLLCLFTVGSSWAAASMHNTANILLQPIFSCANSWLLNREDASPTSLRDSEFQPLQYAVSARSPLRLDPCQMYFWGLSSKNTH